MNIFFCDLYGTFTGAETNRKEALMQFRDNLIYMCKALDIGELYFDFVTTEHMEYLLPYIKEIEPYFEGTPIKMAANQFLEDKKYFIGKIIDISEKTKLDQIRSACNNKLVKSIIFADDTCMQHAVLKMVFNKYSPDIEVISFLPNFHDIEAGNAIVSEIEGIDGLNDTVEKHISDLKKTKTL